MRDRLWRLLRRFILGPDEGEAKRTQAELDALRLRVDKLQRELRRKTIDNIDLALELHRTAEERDDARSAQGSRRRALRERQTMEKQHE